MCSELEIPDFFSPKTNFLCCDINFRVRWIPVDCPLRLKNRFTGLLISFPYDSTIALFGIEVLIGILGEKSRVALSV